MNKNVFYGFFAFFLLILPFSCATIGERRSSSEDLAKTVREFYELKKLGRFDEAWNYERMSIEPDEKKREQQRRVYLSRSGAVPLKDFEILEIGSEGSGTAGYTPVMIKLVTDWPALAIPLPKGDKVTKMEDLWEKINEKWYHVVRGIKIFW